MGEVMAKRADQSVDDVFEEMAEAGAELGDALDRGMPGSWIRSALQAFGSGCLNVGMAVAHLDAGLKQAARENAKDAKLSFTAMRTATRRR